MNVCSCQTGSVDATDGSIGRPDFISSRALRRDTELHQPFVAPAEPGLHGVADPFRRLLALGQRLVDPLRRLLPRRGVRLLEILQRSRLAARRGPIRKAVRATAKSGARSASAAAGTCRRRAPRQLCLGMAIRLEMLLSDPQPGRDVGDPLSRNRQSCQRSAGVTRWLSAPNKTAVGAAKLRRAEDPGLPCGSHSGLFLADPG